MQCIVLHSTNACNLCKSIIAKVEEWIRDFPTLNAGLLP